MQAPQPDTRTATAGRVSSSVSLFCLLENHLAIFLTYDCRFPVFSKLNPDRRKGCAAIVNRKSKIVNSTLSSVVGHFASFAIFAVKSSHRKVRKAREEMQPTDP